MQVYRCLTTKIHLSYGWECGHQLSTSKFLVTKHIHIPKLLCTKLDPKSCKCFFLGYCDETKAYHLWDDTAQRLVISCDVMFDEEITSKSKHHVFQWCFTHDQHSNTFFLIFQSSKLNMKLFIHLQILILFL